MTPTASIARRVWPMALLAVLVCLWWAPLLSGWYPDYMDSVAQTIPWRMAVARQLSEGTLPLWLPNQFCGTPLAANPQVAVWYPLNWLFFLAPGPVTFGFVLVLHYIIGGAGTYALATRLGARRVPALFGAMCFAFGSWMVARIALGVHVCSAAWIPWMFLAAESAARTRVGLRPTRGAIALGVLAAVQLLAGAPQISYYTAVGIGIYWLVRATTLGPQGSRVRAFVRALVHGGAAAVLALLLAGIQLVPTLEFLSQCERANLDLHELQGEAIGGSNTWRAFVGGTLDDGEDTDTIAAIGWGATMLAGFAFARRRRGAAVALLLISVAGYVLALGALVPLWGRVIPLYDHFHAPRRALLLWAIAGPVLAALGAQQLYALSRRARLPRNSAALVLCILFSGTVALLPGLERRFADPKRFLPDTAMSERIGDERFFAVDPELRWSHGSRREDYGLSLMPNSAAWDGLFDAQGYDPLVLRRYGLVRNLASARTGRFYPSHGVYFTDPTSPVLDLLSVRYVIGRVDVFDTGRLLDVEGFDRTQVKALYRTVQPHPLWPLLERTAAPPLAWFAQRVQLADDEADALLIAASAMAGRVAAIEAGLDFLPFEFPPETRLTRLDGRTMRVEWTGPLEQDALLCIAENWMPGWAATDQEGDALEVVPANGFMIGVSVPAGSTSIEVRYAPQSLGWGSVLTLIGALVALLAWRRAPRHGP